jgi:hypothetical protein
MDWSIESFINNLEISPFTLKEQHRSPGRAAEAVPSDPETVSEIISSPVAQEHGTKPERVVRAT